MLGTSGDFSDKREFNFNCRNTVYVMKLNSLIDKQNITLSCIKSGSTVKGTFFNDNLDSFDSYELFTQCDSINSHSIIQYNSSLFVISDVICNNSKICFEPLIGELTEIQTILKSQKAHDAFEEEEKEEEKEEKEEEEIEEISEDLQIEEEEEEKKSEELTEEKKTELTEQKFDCSSLEKCKICDKESFDKNLCIKCNNEKKYYYLNMFPYKQRGNYIDCVNEITKPSRFYFNKNNLDYEPCFTTCASCEYGGNYEENNCTSCDGINYIKNPEDENSSNCLM